MAQRRPGLAPLPASLLRPATPPEPRDDDDGRDRDGDDPRDDDADPAAADRPGPDEGQGGGPPEARPARRARPRRPAAAEKPRARKLHLPDDVHDRLQLLALQRRSTLSAVAAEVLDRGLPRFRVERDG